MFKRIIVLPEGQAEIIHFLQEQQLFELQRLTVPLSIHQDLKTINRAYWLTDWQEKYIEQNHVNTKKTMKYFLFFYNCTHFFLNMMHAQTHRVDEKGYQNKKKELDSFVF